MRQGKLDKGPAPTQSVEGKAGPVPVDKAARGVAEPPVGAHGLDPERLSPFGQPFSGQGAPWDLERMTKDRALTIESAILAAVDDPRMRAIRDSIRDREGIPDWDWTHGGCHAFAPALKESLGGIGEIVGVMQFEQPPGTHGSDCWVNQHSLVRVDDFLFDAKGLQKEKGLKTSYRMTGAAWPPRPMWISSIEEARERYEETGEDFFMPEDEFVAEDIVGILREYRARMGANAGDSSPKLGQLLWGHDWLKGVPREKAHDGLPEPPRHGEEVCRGQPAVR